ncbi:TonB-dependent receptor family protein [Costertonia aggregata]|uniref:TonB-dependent receptor n=1 Tax=Costertonia aggregata TaxID=343403 RepID=A0A7H9APP1_9FLAO|nr:TonB-dependent receptor family protein [Costertonia aggregata]QLG45396.1 TonB-dependent receptor [Costertonia aggregata]
MRPNYFAGIFFLLLPLLLFSQTHKISGFVKSNKSSPLPFANVFLLNIPDSSLVKGSSADENGYFVFTDIPKGIYLVKAGYFGSETVPIAIDVSKDVSIGALIMEKTGETLDEVTVVAKQPTLERKPDRIVFNVENTAVSQSSSWDIIRNTPGVINAQNGLQIRGQEATIYLNDRKIQLTSDEVQSFLEGLSGENIKSIEVIPNPPARYEAEGGPILNITTSKNITPGYKGSVNGNYAQAIFPKYSFGTSHYYKTEKLSLFGNYTINPRKDFQNTNSDIFFIDANNTNFAFWETDLEKTTRSLAQNANVIVDYRIDDKNNLNFTSYLGFSPNKRTSNTVATEMRNASRQIDSTLATTSSIVNDNLNLGLDATYEHRFKKEGSQLIVNVHYTKYTDDGEQTVASRYSNAVGNSLSSLDFSTVSDQEIDIFTGQLDVVSPLGKASLETGAKISSITSLNTYDFFDIEGNQSILNTSLSDNFEYNEQVYAGYVSLLRNWDKWAVKVGLRGEQTDVKGVSLALNTINNQNYFELFPSFYLLHNVDDESSFSFDYSRKLKRPNYQDLNPFRLFLNENDFNEGNPDLRPNFSHNFNLNYALKSTYFFDFYYRDNGEYISTLSFQDNESQTLKQVQQNVDESISYGLDFTVSTSVSKIWYLYAYTSLFYESETFLALESNDQLVKNEVEGVYVSLNNYITLSKDGTFNGEINLNYLSTFIAGSYVQSDPSTVLNIGLKKSLWNKRAVVSLTAEDLLGRANPRYTSRYLNQDNSYRPVPETQFVRLGFKYNFGNFKLGDNERAFEKKERDRLKSDD